MAGGSTSIPSVPNVHLGLVTWPSGLADAPNAGSETISNGASSSSGSCIDWLFVDAAAVDLVLARISSRAAQRDPAVGRRPLCGHVPDKRLRRSAGEAAWLRAAVAAAGTAQAPQLAPGSAQHWSGFYIPRRGPRWSIAGMAQPRSSRTNEARGRIKGRLRGSPRLGLCHTASDVAGSERIGHVAHEACPRGSGCRG